MDIELGEIFKLDGEYYHECGDPSVRRELESCSGFCRKDSQGVIFVKTEAPFMETEAPRCLTFEKGSSNRKKILLLI